MISETVMNLQMTAIFDPNAEGGWEADQLVLTAQDALKNASVPLSRFRVGAAVLTQRGRIFEGCNTESLIPVLGVCAERNAIKSCANSRRNGFPGNGSGFRLALSPAAVRNLPAIYAGVCPAARPRYFDNRGGTVRGSDRDQPRRAF